MVDKSYMPSNKRQYQLAWMIPWGGAYLPDVVLEDCKETSFVAYLGGCQVRAPRDRERLVRRLDRTALYHNGNLVFFYIGLAKRFRSFKTAGTVMS
jgi:hypothetical protein